MPERDELDRMIDAELARYGEPRVGLEQRILARVSAQGSRPSWPVRAWQVLTLAGAIAALVFAMSILFLPRTAHRGTGATTARSTSPNRGAAVSSKNQTPEARIQTPNSTQKAKTPRDVAQRPRSLALSDHVRRPKLDVFPISQPLSEQEQALVAIATAPDSASRENLFASKRQLDVALQISAISIPPLTEPDEGIK